MNSVYDKTVISKQFVISRMSLCNYSNSIIIFFRVRLSRNIGNKRNFFSQVKNKIGTLFCSTHKSRKNYTNFSRNAPMQNFKKSEHSEESSRLKWTIYLGSRNICVNYQLDTDKLSLVLYRSEQHIFNRFRRGNIIHRIWNFSSNECIFELNFRFFQAVLCTGCNNCSLLKRISSGINLSLLGSFLRYCSRVKLSFDYNSSRKHVFLSACRCWDDRNVSLQMDQKFKLDGTIGCRASYWEFFISHSKVFRHAILHDAAGAAGSHSREGLGFCYKVWQRPKFFFIGHVTGQLFCLNVKLFITLSFNFSIFWGNMSRLVLDIELADRQIINE